MLLYLKEKIMTSKMFKYSPIAVSIAVSLTLAGCHSDSSPLDNPVAVNPPPPPAPVSLSDTVSFTTEVAGTAVKGTMAKAKLAVYRVNEAGEMEPIPFRLSASTEAETYSVEAPGGTTDAELQAMIDQKVMELTPTEVRTGVDGSYRIYIDDEFSGSIVIKATTSKDDADNWVRCDALTGCGTYEQAAPTVVPNDGDLDIEFGEWYKDDLELTAVKVISAAAENTPSAHNGGNGRHFVANLSVLSSLASKILLDGAVDYGIDADRVAEASLQTIIQLFGPDATTQVAGLLSDLSAGGAIDLSDIGDDDNLDAGSISLVQLAASLQTIAANTGQSLGSVISQLAQGVANGDLNSNNGLADLVANIQQAVTNAANIFVAVVTGDTVGFDPSLVGRIEESLNRAIDNGLITQEELIGTAEEVKQILDDLGCLGEDCVANDTTFTNIANRLEQEIANVDQHVDMLAASIDSAVGAIASANELSTVTDVDTAITYYEAALSAYHQVFANNGKNVLGKKASRLEKTAEGLVASAKFLKNKNESYDSLLTAAKAVRDKATIEAEQVTGDTGVHVEAQVLLDDALSKLEEFDAVVTAAERQAQQALDMAIAKVNAADQAKHDADDAYNMAVAMPTPMSVEAAAEYLAKAEAALTAQNAFISAAREAIRYAELAITAAEKFSAKAATETDQNNAAQMKSNAEMQKDTAKDLLDWAKRNSAGGIKDRIELIRQAKERKAIIDKLPMVKETTQSFADINFITAKGRNALVSLAQTLEDVLKEAVRNSDPVSDVPSASHTGWVYSYNPDNMTISASKAGEASLTGVMELMSQNGITQGVIAWGAELTIGGEMPASFKIKTGEINECTAAVQSNDEPDLNGSCVVFDFDGDFSTLSEVKNASVVRSASFNQVELVDGATGFSGKLVHMHDNHPERLGSPYTQANEFIMAGMSGDFEFELTIQSGRMGLESEHNVVFASADHRYMMTLHAENDDNFMGDIMFDDYDYGDAMELPRGLEASYIDGTVVTYDGLSFTADQF
jgi:hypothetical protein